VAQAHKAYVAITSVGRGDHGIVSYSLVVVNPDNTTDPDVSTSGSVIFNYGDSNHAIREAIAEEARVQAGDPDIDVNFVTG